MLPQNAIRTGLVASLLLVALLGASPLRPVRAGATPEYEPGQVVVRLKPLAGDISGVNQTYGTAVISSLLHHDDIFLLEAPPGVDAAEMARLMASDPRLVYAELNFINDTPEDGNTDRIYGWGGEDPAPFRNQDATKSMRLSSVHAATQGQGALVAVLDTGVQLGHPALRSRLSPLGLDFVDGDATPEDERNGLDDDGDGQIDELAGHGTHVAGIVNLVAPEASILPLRVLNSDGRGNNFRTANAILYAAFAGADAINLSLGTTQPSALLRDAVREAASHDAVVIAAAGNRNTTIRQYPAADECAVAVTSVDIKDRKASFANYGDWIDLAAPGVNVLSTFPIDAYAWASGTSMSAPFVAGQAGLLRSLNQQLTLQQVGQLIGGSAQSLDNKNRDYTGLLGEGLIDILASVQAQSAGSWLAPEKNVFANCQP